MVLLQLLGMVAFILASVILGVKLLLLWHRTHELPELSVGLGFLLGGGLGYVSFMALTVAMMQGNLVLIRIFSLVGLAFCCCGALLMGVAAREIYRPTARWPWLYLGVISAFMLGGWITLLRLPAGQSSALFWWTITPSAFIYAWVGLEGWLLQKVLAKRARLGMADPLVVSRAFQWSLSSLYVVVMITIGPIVYLMGSQDASHFPAWASMLQSGCGLATAGAIWLGFFPPAFYRGRLAKTYGA